MCKPIIGPHMARQYYCGFMDDAREDKVYSSIEGRRRLSKA